MTTKLDSVSATSCVAASLDVVQITEVISVPSDYLPKVLPQLVGGTVDGALGVASLSSSDAGAVESTPAVVTARKKSPGIIVLKLSLARTRLGFEDYILSARLDCIAKPGADEEKQKVKPVLRLHLTKKHGLSAGCLATATVLLRELPDLYPDVAWDSFNVEVIAKTLAPSLKFFGGNLSMQTLVFETTSLS